MRAAGTVITTGIYLKLEWYADNWDTTTVKVSLNFNVYRIIQNNSYSSNLN